MASPTRSCESGRFSSAARHYLAGRPPYAARLVRRVAALAGLSRRHRVLDLGCGPGQLARALAPLAGQVVAMDPEPEMLRVARDASAGIGNIRFVSGGSDELSPALGRFRLVAMGRSFHWMDRAETLRRLDRMIEPGGGIALFHTDPVQVPENAWVERFRAVRQRYDLHEPRQHGPGWLRHEAFLLDSPFCVVDGCSALERRRIAAETLIDRAFSMSRTAPARLGGHAAGLERELRLLLAEIAPDGQLTEVVESSALLARRPGEEDLP